MEESLPQQSRTTLDQAQHHISHVKAVEKSCCDLAARDYVTFMALSCDSISRFTTIADFATVIGICLNQRLIDQEMFAIDGINLPSNASQSKSGNSIRRGVLYQLGGQDHFFLPNSALAAVRLIAATPFATSLVASDSTLSL
jgi:hypothetical protein